MPDAPVATYFRIEIDGQPLDPAVALERSPPHRGRPSPAPRHVRDRAPGDAGQGRGAARPTPRSGRRSSSPGGRSATMRRCRSSPARSRRSRASTARPRRRRSSSVATTRVTGSCTGGARPCSGSRSTRTSRSQMASQLGLEVGTIADSRTVFEYVHQAGQTAWEFLGDMAGEVGFQVGVTDGKFNFAPPPAASSGPGRRRPQQHQPAPAGLRAGAEGVPPTDDGREPGRQGQRARLGRVHQERADRRGADHGDRRPAAGYAAIGGHRVRLARRT